MIVRFVISVEVGDKADKAGKRDEPTPQRVVPLSKEPLIEVLPSLIREWVLPWLVG